MKFRRKQKPNQKSGRRQVVAGGRSSAFSYHANRTEQEYNLGRSQPRDQDTRRKERLVRYWRQRLGMLLAGIVLIICVLDVLHLSATPNIIPLATSSNNSFLQPTAVYQQAAAKLFASSVFNDNKVTINSQAIQSKLKQQFPEFSDVSVTLPLMGHRPIVYIAPTSPGLLLKTASGDFVLDTNGKALLASSQVDNLTKLQLPTVVDQSGLRVAVGSTALPGTSVKFIQTVVGELQAKSVKFSSLTLPNTAYELDVTPSGAGYYVKFNLHQDSALQQIGTYLAVSQRLAAQSIKPASLYRRPAGWPSIL